MRTFLSMSLSGLLVLALVFPSVAAQTTGANQGSDPTRLVPSGGLTPGDWVNAARNGSGQSSTGSSAGTASTAGDFFQQLFMAIFQALFQVLNTFLTQLPTLFNLGGLSGQSAQV